MERIAAIFRSAGKQTEVRATTGAGSAIQQTQDAVASGFDTVIACGGDGTANEVMNGVMRARSSASVGVVPLGSGNLLATDLLLSRNPESAARMLLNYQPCEIRPGTITFQTKTGSQTRYFLIAAGVGADAELMYRTAVGVKERWGRKAYFFEMGRMIVRRHFPMFQVEWREKEGATRCEQVALVMAIRAKRFPGILRRVRLGCDLQCNEYRLLLFRTDKVRHFLNYFASVASGLNWRVPGVELAFSNWFRCTANERAGPSKKHIHSEADGELFGTLPVETGIAEQTFRLLMPDTPIN
jgi:diacylglycerol kinase (ATP)